HADRRSPNSWLRRIVHESVLDDLSALGAPFACDSLPATILEACRHLPAPACPLRGLPAHVLAGAYHRCYLFLELGPQSFPPRDSRHVEALILWRYFGPGCLTVFLQQGVAEKVPRDERFNV